MDKLPRPYRPGKAPTYTPADGEDEDVFSRPADTKKKPTPVEAVVVSAPQPDKFDRRLARTTFEADIDHRLKRAQVFWQL